MTSVKSVLSVFKNPTHHAITKNIRVLRKIIRVIRAIRVQNPTHHALTRNIRVLRKNPCNPCSETLRVTPKQRYPRPQKNNPCSKTPRTTP